MCVYVAVICVNVLLSNKRTSSLKRKGPYSYHLLYSAQDSAQIFASHLWNIIQICVNKGVVPGVLKRRKALKHHSGFAWPFRTCHPGNKSRRLALKGLSQRLHALTSVPETGPKDKSPSLKFKCFFTMLTLYFPLNNEQQLAKIRNYHRRL